ncbi:hypothetical protein SDC9_173168 [bioreactor metagenome]|uniref:Uncharacterized protein n=1 Tax=bioreactor metagenome TaxID=1076179 RepID=A0A645GQ08_9ZZZZ
MNFSRVNRNPADAVDPVGKCGKSQCRFLGKVVLLKQNILFGFIRALQGARRCGHHIAQRASFAVGVRHLFVYLPANRGFSKHQPAQRQGLCRHLPNNAPHAEPHQYRRGAAQGRNFGHIGHVIGKGHTGHVHRAA